MDKNQLGPVGRVLEGQHQASEELREAGRKFFDEFTKSLGIPKIIDWMVRMVSRIKWLR